MRLDLATIDLNSIAPQVLKKDIVTNALFQVISEEIQKMIVEIDSVLSKELPEIVLDIKAYEKHVDFYRSDLQIEQKRSLIQKSKYFHKQKGTPAAVDELISTLFGQGRVIEWFEYGGEPFYFKVRTNNFSVVGEQTENFIKSVETVKNKRSRLEVVELEWTYSEDINLSESYSIFSYPFQVFASQNTYTGVHYDGVKVRPFDQSVTYGNTTEVISLKELKLQNPYSVAGTLLSGGQTVAALVKPLDQAIIYNQNFEASSSFQKTNSPYKLTGTIHAG